MKYFAIFLSVLCVQGIHKAYGGGYGNVKSMVDYKTAEIYYEYGEEITLMTMLQDRNSLNVQCHLKMHPKVVLGLVTHYITTDILEIKVDETNDSVFTKWNEFFHLLEGNTGSYITKAEVAKAIEALRGYEDNGEYKEVIGYYSEWWQEDGTDRSKSSIYREVYCRVW